eukprot:7984998-Alexandrium_andersonii.AAC.1
MSASLVGSEMCIRDSLKGGKGPSLQSAETSTQPAPEPNPSSGDDWDFACLLYTSDAADDM